LLQQIPRSHHLEDKYLVYLDTNALLGQIGFLLNEKGPRRIQDAYHMATKIKENISSPKGEYLSSPKIKVDYPEDTPDIISLDDVASLNIFIRELNEWCQ
jgi:hypothetical protein